MKYEATLIGLWLACLVAVVLLMVRVSHAEDNPYKKVEPAVVTLHMMFDGGSGICSGAFVDKEGDILTCAHCFRMLPSKIFIQTSDGKVQMARSFLLSRQKDLAVVFTDEHPKTVLQLGKAPHIGQKVFAFGSPLDIRMSMSEGYIENVMKDDRLSIIIHDAPINPGNSGGPLVDKKGRLVGVNEATIMANPFIPAEGLFIAISVDEVKEFLGITNEQ